MSIKVENLSYTYMTGTPYAHVALQNIDLQIEQGDFVALVGHTGSGKSTFIQTLNGLLQPSAGRVWVDDLDLSVAQGAKLARKKVGMVFQYPEQQLFAETVFEDVAFGAVNKGLGKEDVDKAVAAALNFVGLNADYFGARNPLQLSGGQKRRVAIAGVLAMEPEYLILDEPGAGLDPAGRKKLFGKIRELNKVRGMGIIWVTHSMEEALVAKRLLVMDQGRIMFDGTPAQIFAEKAAELRDIGLEEPDIYQLTGLLRQRGLDIPYTSCETELTEAIIRAKRKNHV